MFGLKPKSSLTFTEAPKFLMWESRGTQDWILDHNSAMASNRRSLNVDIEKKKNSISTTLMEILKTIKMRI